MSSDARGGIGGPCPKCGGASGVYDSRPPGMNFNASGFLVRRRKCKSCDYRWATYEVPRDIFLSATKARIALNDAIARLTAARDALDDPYFDDDEAVEIEAPVG